MTGASDLQVPRARLSGNGKDTLAKGQFRFSGSLSHFSKMLNREKKSSRHVPMVATFLDDNKPKIHLKSKFALFQT